MTLWVILGLLTGACAQSSSEPLEERSADQREVAPVVTENHGSSTTHQTSQVVTVSPAESLQELVDRHPPGSHFRLQPGLHRLSSVEPKDGNRFMGSDGATLSGALIIESAVPEGRVWLASVDVEQSEARGQCEIESPMCSLPEMVFLDGSPLDRMQTRQEVKAGTWYLDYQNDELVLGDDPRAGLVELALTPHAFFGTARDVTIEGLVIEKYANPAQTGAIHGKDGMGWVIVANEIRFNSGAGVRLGEEMRLLDNHIHHNGQIGLVGGGQGILVEGNQISFNNIRGFDAGWEGGGAKFVKTRDLAVRHNRVLGNGGPGLWTDIDNIDTIFEQNQVTGNGGMGIFHEISYAAVIRDNLVEENGFDHDRWLYGAGILIAHSPNVEVYGNRVSGNANGIAGIQQDRGEGIYGPHQLENLLVRGNHVSMAQGVTGVGQAVDDFTIFTSRNIRFEGNTYLLDSDEQFVWFNQLLTPEQWQAYGHDLEGLFLERR